MTGKTMPADEAITFIGKQVVKRSNKPFKSGNKINTVTSVTVNENTEKTAFTFAEDDSVVDSWICHLPEKETRDVALQAIS